MEFDEAIKIILKHEGGYVNHPSDPGGMTNLGVTKRVYEKWVGHKVDESTMRNLTYKDVAPIYKKRYWDKSKCDQMPSGVDLCLFDSAVNSGPRRAARWLQEAVGATADGIIGPKTLAAVAAAEPSVLINDYLDIRLRFLQSLRNWKVFGRGWERRVKETRKLALDVV